MSTFREPVFFQGNGQPLNKTTFMQNLESAIRNKPKNVILLGENHSDPSSHILELEILQKAAELKPGEYRMMSQQVLDLSKSQKTAKKRRKILVKACLHSGQAVQMFLHFDEIFFGKQFPKKAFWFLIYKSALFLSTFSNMPNIPSSVPKLLNSLSWIFTFTCKNSTVFL